MAGSEVGGKVTNEINQNDGTAFAIGGGDAAQAAILVKNSEIKGDVTNSVEQGDGTAFAIGGGDAAQGAILVK
jgi:hypothetical protein